MPGTQRTSLSVSHGPGQIPGLNDPSPAPRRRRIAQWPPARSQPRSRASRSGRFLGVPDRSLGVVAVRSPRSCIVVYAADHARRTTTAWSGSHRICRGDGLDVGPLGRSAHELGHVGRRRLMRSRVFRVEIGFLGGVTITSTGKERPAEEFWVSVAGPADVAGAGRARHRRRAGRLDAVLRADRPARAAGWLVHAVQPDRGRVQHAAGPAARRGPGARAPSLWRLRGNRFSAAFLASTIGQVLAVALMIVRPSILAVARGMRSEDISSCLRRDRRGDAVERWPRTVVARRGATRYSIGGRSRASVPRPRSSTRMRRSPTRRGWLDSDRSSSCTPTATGPVGIVTTGHVRAAAEQATGRGISSFMRPLEPAQVLPSRRRCTTCSSVAITPARGVRHRRARRRRTRHWSPTDAVTVSDSRPDAARPASRSEPTH